MCVCVCESALGIYGTLLLDDDVWGDIQCYYYYTTIILLLLYSGRPMQRSGSEAQERQCRPASHIYVPVCAQPQTT